MFEVIKLTSGGAGTQVSICLVLFSPHSQFCECLLSEGSHSLHPSRAPRRALLPGCSLSALSVVSGLFLTLPVRRLASAPGAGGCKHPSEEDT